MDFSLIPARDFISALGDFFLPRHCMVCGRVLLRKERHLCLYCLYDLPRTYFELSLRNPMAIRFNEMIQRDLTEYEPFSRAAALFYYSSNASYRNIPWRIKYGGDMQAGKYFGRMLGEALAASELFSDVDCILPVPLHPLRRWRRGYNQAEIIARGAAEVMGVPCRCDVLRRRRRTGTQTRLSIEEKMVNVRSAFRADAGAMLNYRHLLIIDDVFTTGATMNACRKALRDSLRTFGISSENIRISVAALACVGAL